MARLKGPYIWEEHEYLHQEKTSDWYWSVGIIAVSATVLAIIFGNMLFALLLLLSAFSLALYASRKPDLVRFEVNLTGVIIGKTLYPYSSLHSFCVEDDSHINLQSKLILKSKKMAVHLLVIPLASTIDPKELRDFLFDHLPEDEHSEPLAQKVLEYLGF
ncbi:MAG: hypothetical protein RL094_71 [Candidatus Parcubacteria bacterium]|jgi:hypothetical protein